MSIPVRVLRRMRNRSSASLWQHGYLTLNIVLIRLSVTIYDHEIYFGLFPIHFGQAHLCIKKAVTVIILIVNVRNVVVVIVVVVHVVPEAVPISVPVQVLGGKDNAKDGKEEEHGQEEFVRTHYDLENCRLF